MARHLIHVPALAPTQEALLLKLLAAEEKSKCRPTKVTVGGAELRAANKLHPKYVWVMGVRGTKRAELSTAGRELAEYLRGRREPSPADPDDPTR